MNQKYQDAPGAQGCIFPDLRPGETLKLVVRRHWIVLILASLNLLGVVALAGIATLLYKTGLPPVYTHLILIFTWIFGLQAVFIRWINDELDIFLITDQRIIGFIQEGFLSRKTAQASISHVQEVNAETTGVFGSLLHYGPVYIQTASETTDLVMPTVPEALDTSREISNLVERARHGLPHNQARTPEPKKDAKKENNLISRKIDALINTK